MSFNSHIGKLEKGIRIVLRKVEAHHQTRQRRDVYIGQAWKEKQKVGRALFGEHAKRRNYWSRSQKIETRKFK